MQKTSEQIYLEEVIESYISPLRDDIKKLKEKSTDQKPILVIYFGIKNSNVSIDRVHQEITNAKKSLERSKVNELMMFFFLINSELEYPTIKIECLNPIRVSDSEFKTIEARMSEIQKIADESIKDIQSVVDKRKEVWEKRAKKIYDKKSKELAQMNKKLKNLNK